MNPFKLAPLALVVSSIVISGCGKKDTEGADGSSSAAASAAAPKKEKRKKNESSQVVKMAEAVVKDCKWERGWFDNECKPAEEWRDKSGDLLEDGKADTDLLALLADERPAMRYLAASALSFHGEKYKTDPALAGEVFDAAESEKDEYVQDELGEVLARVEFAKTKLLDRAKVVMKDGAPAKLRAPFFANVGSSNREDQDVENALRDMTLAAAGASDNALRASVMRGLSWFDASPAVCAAWVKGLADPKKEVVEAALDRAPAKCPSTFDAVLAAVDKAEKPVFQFWYPRALIEVCAKGSADQKKRALEMAQSIGTTSKSSSARWDALKAANTCDGEAGKALAKKLEKDENEAVRKEAEKIIKGQ